MFLRINDPEDDFFSVDPDITVIIENIILDDISSVFDELNVPFSLNEVSESIKQLKMAKQVQKTFWWINSLYMPGGSDILTSHLASLFVFGSGGFPEDWCEGLLIPLHKIGSKQIAGNYRGITHLSELGN